MKSDGVGRCVATADVTLEVTVGEKRRDLRAANDVAFRQAEDNRRI
jgi:hypothetical protein